MKKSLFRTKEFKGKVAVQELMRAHLIIALLSFSLAFLIITTTLYEIQLDTFLASIASALLIIVAAVSVSVAVMIRSKK